MRSIKNKYSIAMIPLSILLIGSLLPYVPISAQSVPLQIPIPDLAESITVCNGILCTGIGQYIVAIITWLMTAITLLAVIFIMFGGIWWLTAAGSSKKVGEAKKIILDSLVGLGLALGSVLLLGIIHPDLVNFTGLGIQKIDKIDLNLEFVDEKPELGVPATGSKKRIIVHHSGGPDHAASCHLKRGSDTVDCHYWVKTDGTILPCLSEEKNSRFCQGGANSGSIGIEIVSMGKKFTQKQITVTTNLVKQIAQRHSIPLDNNAATYETFHARGGIFTHATICALVPKATKGKRDVAENILEIIIEGAGGTFYKNMPRCAQDAKAEIQ